MKMRTVILTLTVLALTAAIALAVPAGKQLEFGKSALGTVVFDGKLHNEVAKDCKECHNKDTFPGWKQGTVEITMQKIYDGQLCGICHNGQRAFNAKGNCNRCHKRQ